MGDVVELRPNTNAIFNTTIGIAKLANAVVDSVEDE